MRRVVSRLVNRFLSRQLLIVVAASAGACVFGIDVAYSVALGGLVSLAANAYMVRRVLAGENTEAVARIVLVFFWAEFVRIVMSATLLAAVYVLIEDLNAIALISGFIVAHIGAAVFSGMSGTDERL